MGLLVNDLSIHEQFHNLANFKSALSQLMMLRNIAKRSKLEFYSSSAVLNSNPIPNMSMRQAVGNLDSNDQIRAVMNWLNNSGPFLDDFPKHSEDEYLESCDEVVTGKAIGEAAFRILHGVDCGLASFSPSDWCFTPIQVTWHHGINSLQTQHAEICNCWDKSGLDSYLDKNLILVRTWDDVRKNCTSKFLNLTFSEVCFKPLNGVPFAKSSAERISALLARLNEFTAAIGPDGARNERGNEIYQDYFTGDRAHFTDSSSLEKSEFEHELTFRHPDDPKQKLFCPWHGKESHLNLRIHFSWPVRFGEPVYVVYVGPKITKR